MSRRLIGWMAAALTGAAAFFFSGWLCRTPICARIAPDNAFRVILRGFPRLAACLHNLNPVVDFSVSCIILLETKRRL